MGVEDVKRVAQGLARKKAKVRKLKTEPTGTTEKKLPKDVQKGLEEHFRAKLTKVRVHTGGNAKEVAKQLKAKAFTIGPNIYFAKPGDAKKHELLAHELTHVIQQSGGRMPVKAKPGTALVSK